MAVVASVSPDSPSEDAVVSAFDDLAEGVASDPGPEGVMSFVHGELGFVGNVGDYYSPANSLIHRVLAARRGIPLSLTIVGVEVGRRVGVDLSVVGLPGHVVVGDGRQPQRWFDPFAGGAELMVDDCRRLYGRFNPLESFTTDMLKPIGPTATTIRTLNNLKLAYRNLGDLSQVAKVLELAVSVPGAPISERLELASILGALGRDDQAADQRDRLAELDPNQADGHRIAARRHRARRN